MDLTGLKSKCYQGSVLYRGSRREPVSWLFLLLEVTPIPWLVAPSSILKVNSTESSSPSLSDLYFYHRVFSDSVTPTHLV